MALHRGIQSALFYYLSCAPCSEHRYRKKRKQDAARDRANRDVLEAEIPNLYRHPSPSSTNPYWQAEIALGPNPPPRGKRRTHDTDGTRKLRSSATQKSFTSHDTTSLDLRRSNSHDSRYDSKLRVTRTSNDEGEATTGNAQAARPIRRTHTASSIGDSVPVPARLRTKASTTSDASNSYRNPGISDLHPPVAPRVASREDVAWMLQPPPPAEFMLGRHRSTRTRSDSTESRTSAPSAGHISRQGSTRKRDDTLPDVMEQSPLNSQDFAVNGQNHERIPNATSPQIALIDSLAQSEFRQIIQTSNLDEQNLARPTTSPIRQSTIPTRPKISTVKSETCAYEDRTGIQRPYVRVSSPKENILPPSSPLSRISSQNESPVKNLDTNRSQDSLSVIRALAPNSRLLTRVVTATSPNPTSPLSTGYPGSEERSDGLDSNWEEPDFEVGPWVLEHTKRDVTERWSMDI